MKIVFVVVLVLVSGLAGNKIGFEAAKAKYHGAQQDADKHYGCTPARRASNGECQ